MAGGMLVLVLAKSLVWLTVLRTKSKRAVAWGAAALLEVLLANIAGDWLGLFTQLELLPRPFVILMSFILSLTIAIGMGYAGIVDNCLLRGLNMESLVAP